MPVGELLGGNEFGLSDTVEAVEGGRLDVDVLAHQLGSDTGVAQAQRQRVRQRQGAQRLLACVELIGHLTSVPPRYSRRVSTALLHVIADAASTHLRARHG